MALAQDQTPQTLTLPAALYPHGFKRFIDGLLASGWLVIWVFGELAVLAMMGTTIVSLIDMVVSLSLQPERRLRLSDARDLPRWAARIASVVPDRALRGQCDAADVEP